eukprot:1223670-Amphidinium_carterae.1
MLPFILLWSAHAEQKSGGARLGIQAAICMRPNMSGYSLAGPGIVISELIIPPHILVTVERLPASKVANSPPNTEQNPPNSSDLLASDGKKSGKTR